MGVSWFTPTQTIKRERQLLVVYCFLWSNSLCLNETNTVCPYLTQIAEALKEKC